MIVSVIIVFFIFFIVFLLILKKINTTEKKTQIISAIIGSLLVALVMFLYNILAPIKLPKDYEKINCPNIEPELVIDNVDKYGYHFSFIIRNTGNLPADNIRFIIRTPNVASIEQIPPLNRTLAAHSSMAYNPSIFKTDFDKYKNINKFDLFVSYDAIINDNVKNYYSFFRWYLENNEIREKNYIYHDAHRQEGSLKFEDVSQILNFENYIVNVLEDFPGYAFDLLIKIKDTLIQRDKYILDLGYDENKDRISIFLNNNNDLYFRVIDNLGESYVTIIQKNQYLIDFKNPFYLNCEFGCKKNLSFLKIHINGQEIEQKIINKSIKLSLSDQLLKSIIVGGDINLNNKGIFKLAELGIWGVTHNYNTRNRIGMFFEELDKKHQTRWLNFDGEKSFNYSQLNPISNTKKIFSLP